MESLQNNPKYNATVREIQVNGQTLQGTFYSSGESRKFIPFGTPSWYSMGFYVGYKLLPTPPFMLTPQQEFLLAFVETSGVPIYFSPRLQLQYIYHPDGPMVVSISPASKVFGYLNVGDCITAMDGMPVNGPMDIEVHYRWSVVEKEDYMFGFYWNAWKWLGMF